MTHDDLDRRLRNSNFVSADPDAVPPIDQLFQRLDETPSPSRRTRNWTQILVIAAAGLAVTGTATAAVIVLGDSGSNSGLNRTATIDAPAAGKLTALLGAGAAPLGSEERATFPELGDRGTVSGTTITREGFDIDIAFDTAKICFTAHEPGQRTGNAACTALPIPYRMIPLAEAGNGPRPTRRLAYAIAPDGATELTVTKSDGGSRTARFENNVAAIPLDRDSTVTKWTWKLSDGRTYTR